MSFADEKKSHDDLSAYDNLVRVKASLTAQVSRWMDDGTALHAIVAADKQAEILADRTAFIADLKVALGI